MKNITLFIFFFIFQTSAFSQITIEWQNTIGGNMNDWLSSIQETSDGGYILGGSSISDISGDKTENSHGNFDYWIVKTDATGNIQWQNTIGGSGVEGLNIVNQTSDGGYILGGGSDSNISGDKTENSKGLSDYWIIKTDDTGSIQWQKTIGGNNREILWSIQETTDGGYILGGASNSDISGDKTENSHGGDDYWIVKTDISGNIQWQNTIGGSGNDRLYSLQQTTDGGYILGGASNSDISGDKTENSHGSYDYWVVKTDASGNIQWQKTLGGSGNDGLNSIRHTFDGGYILGGPSNSNISGDKTEDSMGDYDYWIVKIDSIGNIQWQNSIGGSDYDGITSIEQTADAGFILGGFSGSNISGDKSENCHGAYDYWIVKTDSTGNIEWEKTIGGGDYDELYAIQKTSDGSFVLAGSSMSNISGDKTEVSNGGHDYWFVKLSYASAINEILSKVSFSIFPNPTLEEIIVSFSLEHTAEIKLLLFNSLGQLTTTILNENREAGENTINFSMENIQMGIYHLQFSMDGEVMTKKVVKM